MRLSECYGLHFPELRRLCPEGDLYVILVNCAPNRLELGTVDEFYTRCNVMYAELNYEGDIDRKLIETAF